MYPVWNPNFYKNPPASILNGICPSPDPPIPPLQAWAGVQANILITRKQEHEEVFPRHTGQAQGRRMHFNKPGSIYESIQRLLRAVNCDWGVGK